MADYIKNRRLAISDVQSMPGERSCPICKLCTEATSTGHIRLERPHETNVCPAHSPLVSWVRQSFEEQIDHQESQGLKHPKRRFYRFGFYRESGHRTKIKYLDYTGYPTFGRDLLLSIPGEEMKPGIHKQNLDPQWVDLQVARQWMDTCIKEHGSRCSNIFNTPSCSPAYLIDTERNCILQSSNKALEYVALSYRWGNRAGFRTTQTSLASMMGKDSLLKAEGIPPIIYHAMQIVRSIDERYLWVDSICLVSDDEDHLTEQLQLMGSIFACAKLTIVATDGDAWDGLNGIRNTPGALGKPRHLPNTFCYPNGVQITVRDQYRLTQSSGSASEYFQRGWTYQEYFLSQRRLVFSKKQIHWRCSRATWHEDKPDSGEDSYEKTNDQYFRSSNILRGVPDLRELSRMAFEYHTREFTRPDDALPGFSGLLTILTRAFESGFLCGHPETWFDASLMWNCNFYGSWADGNSWKPTLERRKIARQPSTLPGAVIPSWAWIGWKGNQLRLLDDEEDFELPVGLTQKNNMKWRFVTTPVTEWYSHETPTSTKRRIPSFPRVPNVDGNLGDRFQGWITEKYNPSRHRFKSVAKSKVIGKSVYYHPLIPHAYFWAPFPKSSDGQGTFICAPQQYQYISCQTKRGFFGLMSADSRWRKECGLSFDAQAALTDDQGRKCGWLQLAPSDEIALMLERSHHDRADEALAKPISELKVELVAVCQRRRSCPCWPWTDGGCSCGEDFCGVLWVEWADGVAYRRGCGYVKKQMWDSHKLDNVDLVLG